MIEVQRHGLEFEIWVRSTFFSSYEGEYGQEWDILAKHNKGRHIPNNLKNLPVSVKTARYGSPIGLGDALRQRRISIPFGMIAGFWEQRGDAKWFTDIAAVKFTPRSWDKLWGNLKISSLEEIDKQIKNTDLHYTKARQRAKEWKEEAAEQYPDTKIVINPKIDSKKQRRIQCSLPFEIFWNCVGRDARKAEYPELFGKKFPNPIISSPRKFSQS